MKYVAIVGRLLYLGAKAPWVTLVAVAAALHAVGRSLRVVRRFAKSRDTLDCPAGHPNSVLGRWRCGCGFELAGHAFAPCPSCGEEAGWFPCRTCGLGIQDPLQH